MYLVTYEAPLGNYSRSYGVAGVCNKPQEASRLMQRLQKEQEEKGSSYRKIIYSIKIVDVNESLTTELFRFEY